MKGERPQTRYARRGGVNIAYQTIGAGPIDLVFVPNWINSTEAAWEEPSFAAFLRSLATFSRLIWFDKRGTGLSDPIPPHEINGLDDWVEDLDVVLEATGSNKPVLFGTSSGGPICITHAARHPEGVAALILLDTFARLMEAEDIPWGLATARARKVEQRMEDDWAAGPFLAQVAPTMQDDDRFREWWARYRRNACSPGVARALRKLSHQVDVRGLLAGIRTPTLVLHRTGDRYVPVEHGRYLSEKIAGSSLVELPGADHLFFLGDANRVVAEVARFLAEHLGMPEIARLAASSRRSAATWGWDSISQAERRVVELLSEGLTNTEIARRLSLSRHTVDVHVKHVFRKLGVSSRAELIAAANQR